MKKMTDKRVLADWEEVLRRFQRRDAETVTRYCVGNSMDKVAKAVGNTRQWIESQLNRAGIETAIDELNVDVSLTGPSCEMDHKISAVIKKFKPNENDPELTPYIEQYENQGHTPEAAMCLAVAEWAGEEAVEAGVIQVSANRRNKKEARIVLPEDGNGLN
jgi:hypothetical protein